MSALLSRYAESLFWMARYIERAENVTRILEVTRMFSPLSQGVQNWQSVVTLHCDDEEFTALCGEVTEQSVLRFYLADSRHVSSITACVAAARWNANRLRPVMSTELWTQLNVFYNKVRTLESASLDPLGLPQLFAQIRTRCQAHSGIAETAFMRDAGWQFYLIGKYLERADKITRLLDIKYHVLLPSLSEVGSILDMEQWYSILRIVGGYQAFRIRYAEHITPATVAGFLLAEDVFARSVLASVSGARRAFDRLVQEFGHEDRSGIGRELAALEAHLRAASIEDVIHQGLHEYLDDIQLQLIAITNAVAGRYF